MAIGPLSFNESGLFECLVFIPCTGFAYAFSKTENSMSAPKRLLAIINPISGTKVRKKSRSDKGGNRPFEISGGMCFYTVCGHGAELTRRAVDERVDIVLSVGGDGTCNEIARELIDTSTALAMRSGRFGKGLPAIWVYRWTCEKLSKLSTTGRSWIWIIVRQTIALFSALAGSASMHW